MAAPKIAMKNLISTAPQAQEIYNLKNRIEELESELSQFKSDEIRSDIKEQLEEKIKELTNQLSIASGEHEIEVSQIDADNNQPRKSFPKNIIKERAESLLRHGQQTPIIVIPEANGRYTLFEGELRKRAAEKLGWNSLKSVFLPKYLVPEKNELLERQLITSIHSTRLNDLDLAETIIQLLKNRHPHIEHQKIPRLLQSALYQVGRNGKLSELEAIRTAEAKIQSDWIFANSFRDPDEQVVIEIILWLQLNPNSIKAHVFPLLSLPDDLKQAIRQEGLETSKVRELSKISSDRLNLSFEDVSKIRSNEIHEAISNGYSLQQIRARVGQILQQHNPEQIHSKNGKHSKAVEVLQRLDLITLESENLKELQMVLKQKLKELNQLIKEKN
jgi:ParB family transcriptional regulator, chromosome partitioning protein